jgi:replicative DNA helicase
VVREARELKAPSRDPRLPPQNLQAEEAVLGAMMITPGAITAVIEDLREDDFYLDSQRLIFRSIVGLFHSGEPVDPVTVTARLTADGVIERVGGKAYVHTIVSTVPVASNVSRYAAIVRENALLRSLIEVGSRIAELGYDRPGEVDELLNSSEQMVFEISQRHVSGEVRPLGDLLTEQFNRLDDVYKTGKKITGLTSHFADLDKITSGFQSSNLIILAARPSMGKTSLALDIAQNVALKDSIPVLLFSLEMGEDELAQRMMCTQGRVDSQRLRGGYADANDWAKLTDACSRLSNAPIFVDDSGSLSMLQVMAKTRRMASKRPDLGMVIIDYMQLMTPDSRAQNREQEVAKISRALKTMARELKLPVMALSQLSRAPEARTRGDQRPILSDLRESGSIEQDADLVMFIYRQRMEETKLLDTAAELIVAKHRNGPTGKVDLVFDEKYASFKGAHK